MAVFEVFAVVAVADVVVVATAAVVVVSSDAAVVVFVVFAFVAVASDVVVVVVVTSKFVAADENLDPMKHGKVRLGIFRVPEILVFICLNFLHRRNYKKYFIHFLEFNDF